jgi:23S rRNA pseudouridine1911/1915/1917 synthase
VAAGDRLEVAPLPVPRPPGIEAEPLPLDIVYQDDHLVVVNKAPGMVVHPGAGRREGTLVAALLHRFADLRGLPGEPERPGIVHRLDRNTSGLLVVARTTSAMKGLAEQIAEHRVRREYLALVWGCPQPRVGEIDVRITRSRRDRRRMAPSQTQGREATTAYRVLEFRRVASLLELELRTGRTHQIRVHLAHVGHPVVGDPDYGGRQKGLLSLPAPQRPLGRELLSAIDRQALHARRLRLEHPVSGAMVDVTAPPPADFEACCAMLRQYPEGP